MGGGYTNTEQGGFNRGKSLVENVYCRLGVPLRQLSDQGREFDNSLMSGVCNLLKIDKIRTTSYRPNTNGKCERVHRSINATIAKMIDANQRNWPDILPFVMAAYRAAVHDATGYSANFLMLGREVHSPIDLWLDTPDTSRLNVDDFVDAMQERMHYAAQLVRENLNTQSVRNKRYYDMKFHKHQFQQGDWVYLFVPRRRPGKCIKWDRLHHGPYLVIDRIGPVNSIIQRSDKADPIVTHIDKLKLYHGLTPQSWIDTIPSLNIDTQQSTDVLDMNANDVDINELDNGVLNILHSPDSTNDMHTDLPHPQTTRN